MASISASHGNPNPNLHSSVITQPSITNMTKTKRKNKKSKNKKKGKKNPNPNWLELPEDVWFMILLKLKTIDIIENVQKVCMLFRKLCKQPSMFKTIDMYIFDDYHCLPYNVNSMTRFGVDRSAGGLVDIYLEYVCDDETLMYIVSRSKNLKRLRFGNYIDISDEGLVDAVKQLPMLEEIQLSICSFAEDTVEAVGRTCPSLKSFSLNGVGSKDKESACNEGVFAIASSMPHLRHLQLIGSNMTNEGLKAVLDGCPLLESLDLRACFLIDLTGDLGKRCERIKHLRRPLDSLSDYGVRAVEDDDLSGLPWIDPQESEYDSDFSFYGFCPDLFDFDDLPYHDYPEYFDDYDGYDDFTVPSDYFGGPSRFRPSDLRKFLVDRNIIPQFEKQMQATSNPMEHMPPQQWGPPHGLPPSVGGGHGYGPTPQYMPPPPRQHDSYYPPADLAPPLDRQPHQGISAYGREPPMGVHAPSNAQPAQSMITQVTQHMQVPLLYVDSVIGSNGATISYVRRASGATVTIQETRGVPGEMTVEINGTASQVQAAQHLIQNFMADAAAAAAPSQTGGSSEQGYTQSYNSYAPPPSSVYGSPPSSSGQPGAYGSVYGGNYGY